MGWIGVDLDGTLAHYEKWVAPDEIGAPIQKMVLRVKYWLAKGVDVRIVTARAFPLGIDYWASGFGTFAEYEEWSATAKIAKQAIEQWCLVHFGQILPVQSWKDVHMYELWDDRAVQVIPNTGVRVDHADDLKFSTYEENQCFGLVSESLDSL